MFFCLIIEVFLSFFNKIFVIRPGLVSVRVFASIKQFKHLIKVFLCWHAAMTSVAASNSNLFIHSFRCVLLLTVAHFIWIWRGWGSLTICNTEVGLSSNGPARATLPWAVPLAIAGRPFLSVSRIGSSCRGSWKFFCCRR